MTDTATHLAAALGERYRVQRELGHGGMATVYLAEDVKHHRRVAIMSSRRLKARVDTPRVSPGSAPGLPFRTCDDGVAWRCTTRTAQ